METLLLLLYNTHTHTHTDIINNFTSFMGQNVQSNKATRFHILMITGQESQTGLYVFNNAYIYL